MYGWQFGKLQHAADRGGWTRFVSMQNQYNLLRRHDELELMAMCGDMGVGLVPYSPNGKGRLARPAGEQSQRSNSDKVVQAFDSPYDEPVIDAVQNLAESRAVGHPQPSRLGADRRRNQAPPPQRGRRSTPREADRRRGAGARSALPPVRAVLVLTTRCTPHSTLPSGLRIEDGPDRGPVAHHARVVPNIAAQPLPLMDGLSSGAYSRGAVGSARQRATRYSGSGPSQAANEPERRERVGRPESRL